MSLAKVNVNNYISYGQYCVKNQGLEALQAFIYAITYLAKVKRG